MGEAIESLRGKQREVYFLTVREGMSVTEAAEALNMREPEVWDYHYRAIDSVERYCKIAMLKGRI